MKKIILCNNLAGLDKELKTAQRPLDFVCLQESQDDHELCSYLGQLADVTELPLKHLVRKINQSFRAKYIEFMGQINIANHSRQWWAMPFTNKNPLVGRLCRNLFHFQLLIEGQNSDAKTLVALTDNRELTEQVKRWGKSRDVAVISSIATPRSLKDLIRQSTPAGLFKAILSSALLWVLSRGLRPEQNHESEHTLIATHTHTQSFPSDNSYRDVYFGSLVVALADSGEKVIVLGLPYDNALRQLDSMKRLKSDIKMVPVDACLSPKSILACSGKALKAYVRPFELKQPAIFGGVDVTYLVKQAIKETTRSGEFFVNLRMYYSARWLAERVKLGRCLYPYENRAWEKMLLLGIDAAATPTRMVGYQHTSITPHHANLFLAERESEIAPLPSAIVTCGDVTKDWFEKEGNYPEGMFKSACALRQELATEPSVHETHRNRENGSISNLLVVLATGVEEYTNTPRFLEEALGQSGRFQVRLRPHPNLPALEVVPRPFYSVSTGPLAEDLEWADAVLYSSSTVSMEGIWLGLPAIFLDLGDFLSTDPMFGWNEFKWAVREPSELLETVEEIESIPRDRFKELQKKGRDYVISYLKPVTPHNMQPFWDA